MSADGKLSDLELSALLCSRVCHDVISPVGAIANGLEVLDEETDEEMRECALDLVRKSAAQAAAKLQFARIAFGAAGSSGAMIDLGEMEEITGGFIDASKVKLDWHAPRDTRPKDEVKLLLNMILIALAGMPRGGTLTVLVDENGMAVSGTGEGTREPEGMADLIAGRAEPGRVEPRQVQAYYAGRLAEAAGRELALVADSGQVAVTARPLAKAA